MGRFCAYTLICAFIQIGVLHGQPSVGDNPDVAEPESELILLTLPQEDDHHKGGRLLFGADGYLYIGLGDGGFTEEAQNLGSWYGSILRIDVDGGDPYSVPATNPFVARPGGESGNLGIWSAKPMEFHLRSPYGRHVHRRRGPGHC